jgi:MFS family permease
MMKPPGNHGLKAPVYASLALAFASVGDAFLYPFLPVNSASVGIPVVWIGILLSVNRFVRIFSNSWMIHLFAKHGLRLVTIIAVIVAITSTAGYAFAHNLFIWMLFRIAWGLSFSAMRISTLGYALKHSQQGYAFGLTRGIQEAGPMIALFAAPVLFNYVSHTVIFLILAGFSLPALYFSWKLPRLMNHVPPVSGRMFLRFPSVLNSITFVSAFVIDGIIVVVLAFLFLDYMGSITVVMATSLAAFYLGYRRICLVIFSPAGGWMADRIGLRNVFTISLFSVITGLTVLVCGRIELGAIIIFSFYSIHAATTPGNVSGNDRHSLAPIAENATWRDIGAAVGTLSGGLLIASDYLTTILLFTIFGLAFLLFIYMGTAHKTLKYFYSWK